MRKASQAMLSFSLGQYSSAGRKPVNQDAVGAAVPADPVLMVKGAVFAVADGISSSQVSDIASQTSVKSFIEDYFCTSDAWSVRRAADTVLQALSAWLYAQTRIGPFEGQIEKGYVCTFSALVIKHSYAYLFHAGDSRIYLLRQNRLVQLTRDHRATGVAKQTYLSNALGTAEYLQLDHQAHKVEPGDIFILLTDGIHEHLSDNELITIIANQQHDLSAAARQLGEQAYENGSADNITVQLVRVDNTGVVQPLWQYDDTEFPVPPVFAPGDIVDGYHIQRHLYASARSHVYVVQRRDLLLVLKAPSVEQAHSVEFLEGLMMEEWVARRVQSQHLMKAPLQEAQRSYCYTITEYVEGQTLQQWLHDHPSPALEAVRNIIEQVARALMALHRCDVLHRDIRPQNIIVNTAGLVKLIDFGSASVAGVVEAQGGQREGVPGTAMYAAPEYFLGDVGTPLSDQFSLAVLTYYMLSGDYPYGSQVARCRSVAAQHKLSYKTVLHPNRVIPFWVDNALQKALSINPQKRYGELSEFIYDLRYPNSQFVNRHRPPLIKRDPVMFWQGVSGMLTVVTVWLLYKLFV